MGRTSRARARGFWMACAAAAVLTACGGGGGGGTTAAPTLSGIAATGAPVAGGTVSVRCATGSALTATTSTAGAWTVTTSGQTLPCAVQVSGGNLPTGTAYHSVAVAFGNVNVTPLTDLIVARLTTNSPAAWFNTPAFTGVTETTVEQARAAVVTALGLSTALGGRNPLNTEFSPVAGDPVDDVLEAIRTVLNGIEGGYTGLLEASARGDFSGFSGFPAAFTVAIGGAGSCTGNLMAYAQGQAGGPFTNGQQVCVLASINPATLMLDGRSFMNAVQNTAVTAPFAAYAFADGSQTYEVVFNGSQIHEINVMSGNTFLGQLATVPGSGGGTNTLTVQVSANNLPATTITVNDVPRPASETEFCSEVNDPGSDSSLANVAQGVSGSFRIDSCSFSGNQGQVNATLTITSPVSMSIPYVVTYTYN